MAEEKFLFKDIVNSKMVEGIAYRISKIHPEFRVKVFIEFIVPEFPKLEFKERGLQITKGLEKYLPKDFQKAAEILNQSLTEELPQKDILGDRNYDRFYVASYGDFIARNGLDHFEISMNSLYEQTKRFSSEFAIRYFIEAFPKKTLKRLKEWSNDPNLHVRRLVSEGTRPRLPWGIRLKMFIDDPKPVINLLENLKDDPETYVRRSVANSLNDIAKDNPEIVIDTLKKWKNDSPEMKWLISHSLRSLVKDGNQDALKLCGFDDGENIEIFNLKLQNQNIKLGEVLEFRFELKSNKNKMANLMVDYAIYYVKSNRKLSRKVYKLSKLKIDEGETKSFLGKRDFKEITTRKFYSGKHQIEIIVNGKSLIKEDFNLSV